MRKEIYDKSYSNQQITVTYEIWNNSAIHGVAKLMMALYKTMTGNGATGIKNMTIRQSEILSTHLKDIEYNQKQLVKDGFIRIEQDAVLGEVLYYTYNTANTQILQTEDAKNSLF